MVLLYKLKDDQYPYLGIKKTRKVVRAIVINNKNKIAIIHLKGDDIFGHRDYFETPGGGVKKNETLLKALQREIKEELGYSIKDIKSIGKVIDYYNLIKQENINYYFICHIDKKVNKNLSDFEKKFFNKISWLSINTIIKKYENMNKEPLEILVKNRELAIFKLVKEKYF